MAIGSSCTYPYQKGEYSLRFALLEALRVTVNFFLCRMLFWEVDILNTKLDYSLFKSMFIQVFS